MIPTFLGRMQTRILLFLAIGVPITILYSLWLAERNSPHVRELAGLLFDLRPLQVLCLLLIVGLILDPVYYWIQTLRWDSDWPFSFQFVVSILEFLIVLTVIELDLLPSNIMPASSISTPTEYFYATLHFAFVFIPSFIALLGLVQLFMIRWRFKGGEWGRL
jgi:hypothetical protein